MIAVPENKNPAYTNQQDCLEKGGQSGNILGIDSKALSDLLNAIPIPISISSEPDKVILEANKSYLEHSGFKKEEIIGRTLSSLTWSNVSQFDKTNQEFDKEGKLKAVEISLFNKTGEKHTSVLSAETVQFEGKAYTIAASIDITERKKTEQALKESQSFRTSLLENSPNVIIVLDSDGTVRYANPALETLTGYPVTEIIGTREPFPWWTDEVGNGMSIRNVDPMHEKVVISEKKYRKRSGEIFWISNNISIVKENDKVKYYIANWVDITERRKMEERITELYLEEKRQKNLLEAEARSRGLFVNILAHELRTPITPLVISSEMLQAVISTHEQALQKKLTESICQSTQVLVRKLEELLDIARYSRGDFRLTIETLSLQHFFRDIALYMQPELKQKNQELVLSLPENEMNFEADAGSIKQVMVNLLSNAAKFSPNDGKIKMAVDCRNNYIQVKVQDSGPGLTEEALQRLFDPYYSVQQDRQQLPGLGLSMAVVKYIVEAHGGKIRVNTRIGEGSTFIFDLPASQLSNTFDHVTGTRAFPA